MVIPLFARASGTIARMSSITTLLIALIVTKMGAFLATASRVTEGQQCNGVPGVAVVGRLDV
jgi:hypothetical protein